MGYGDLAPKTDIGKLFTVLYIFTGLGILLGFVNPIGEYIIDKRFKVIEKNKIEGKKKLKTNLISSDTWEGSGRKKIAFIIVYYRKKNVLRRTVMRRTALLTVFLAKSKDKG